MGVLLASSNWAAGVFDNAGTFRDLLLGKQSFPCAREANTEM